MKTIILFLALTLTHFFTQAQNETSHWCYGGGLVSGRGEHLYFDQGGIHVLGKCALRGGNGAASSISDSSGNLLFYTNGKEVWNKMDKLMENGSELVPYEGAPQCLIVKKPSSNTLYYIFYAVSGGLAQNAETYYAIVDMSFNLGLGSVISKGNLLFSPSSGKFSAVKHSNGTDIWVISKTVNDLGPSSFRAYLLTANGLNPSPTISNECPADTFGSGQMKFSHNGKMLALGIGDIHRFELLDFDSNSGLLSNPRFSDQFSFFPYCGCTSGVEFSPNDSILYTTINYPPLLLKFDLSIAGNQLEKYTIINTNRDSTLKAEMGYLQLACDGNIYVRRDTDLFEGSSYLGVIQSPNSWYSSKYFITKIENRADAGDLSLPNFEQSLFNNAQCQKTTSVNNINKKTNFTVYPDPFYHEINIDAAFEFSEITLRDIYGRIVIDKHFIHTYKSTLNLYYLAEGLYFITLSSKYIQQTKIVVKE